MITTISLVTICHHTKLLWYYSWYSPCYTFYPRYLFILSLEVCICPSPPPVSLIPSPALSFLATVSVFPSLSLKTVSHYFLFLKLFMRLPLTSLSASVLSILGILALQFQEVPWKTDLPSTPEPQDAPAS